MAKSASNVAERKVITGKAKAAMKGHIGGALAETFIQDADKQAAGMVAMHKTMKDRLKELSKLPRDEHLEFRAALNARQELINNEARKAQLSLNAYREADEYADSMYVTLSLWLKMSRALEVGFQPDYDKPWSFISKTATESLNAQAQREAQEKLMQERQAVEQDDTIKPEVKEAKIVLLNEQIVQSATQISPTRRVGRPEKSLIEKLQALMVDRPLQELEECHKWLGNLIAEKKGANRVQATPSGRAKAASNKSNVQEHATASK